MAFVYSARGVLNWHCTRWPLFIVHEMAFVYSARGVLNWQCTRWPLFIVHGVSSIDSARDGLCLCARGVLNWLCMRWPLFVEHSLSCIYMYGLTSAACLGPHVASGISCSPSPSAVGQNSGDRLGSNFWSWLQDGSGKRSMWSYSRHSISTLVTTYRAINTSSSDGEQYIGCVSHLLQ